MKSLSEEIRTEGYLEALTDILDYVTNRKIHYTDYYNLEYQEMCNEIIIWLDKKYNEVKNG